MSEVPPAGFVRYRSPVADPRLGLHVGIFGLVNQLGRGGLLSADDEAFRRTANAWFDAAYPDPCTVDPSVYDRTVNPGAVAWFRTTATHLLERVPPYLDLLDRYAVAWERVESDDPGRVVYADDVQVVVVP